MKQGKSIMVIVLVLSVAFCLLTAVCAGYQAQSWWSPTQQVAIDRSEDFIRYFPTNVGSEWTYRIQFGSTDPLTYKEPVWPYGDGKRAIFQTSRVRIFTQQKVPPPYYLKLGVTQITNQQGWFSIAGTPKLEVLRDDLNLFDGASGVYWVRLEDEDGFNIIQEITYSPYSSNSPFVESRAYRGYSSSKQGYSHGFFFFADESGTRMSIGEDPQDKLTYLGVDTTVPGYLGLSCLHYLREVQPGKMEAGEVPGYLDQGFTEHTWFAEGIGLVRLEQKVNGRTSMTWVLEKFTPGY